MGIFRIFGFENEIRFEHTSCSCCSRCSSRCCDWMSGRCSRRRNSCIDGGRCYIGRKFRYVIIFEENRTAVYRPRPVVKDPET